MSVRFHVSEVVRRYTDHLAEVDVEGATVGEVLENLFGRYPDLRLRVIDRHGRVHPYLILFLDGQELPRATLLDAPAPDGAVLELVGAAEGGAAQHDVRMRGFQSRVSVDDALAAVLGGAAPLPQERVSVTACAGRVLASDVSSEVNVPAFARSAMDGYAVRAEDTFGASLYDPLPLTLIGECLPGDEPTVTIGAGQACRIMTGAPVPPGADAVLKAELAREETAPTGGSVVLATAAIAPGKNVGRVGEDVSTGTLLLGAGRRLRPQDVGLLASVGVGEPAVHRRPRVRILVSGNELLPPGSQPGGCQIVDSNSPMLAALIERDGGEVESVRQVADEQAALREALADPGADVILTSGGTSVGCEDYLPLLVAELGELVVHGVAMRPSSPTGFGRIGEVRVLLLPGNPVACLAAYDFFGGPLVRRLAGLPQAWPYPAREVVLSRRIVSQIGRTDYARVAITDDRGEPLAVSGASLLSSTTRTDGFVVVPAGLEGFPEGTPVTVHLYDALPVG